MDVRRPLMWAVAILLCVAVVNVWPLIIPIIGELVIRPQEAIVRDAKRKLPGYRPPLDARVGAFGNGCLFVVLIVILLGLIVLGEAGMIALMDKAGL